MKSCFFRDQVKKGIKSFKRGSAPRLDGCRAEHLQAMVGNGSSGWEVGALTTITNTVNYLATGDIPDTVRPFFFGARLHAALKKDGGIRNSGGGGLEEIGQQADGLQPQ